MPGIEVGRAGIACAEAGEGPPVVPLHGSACPAGQWRGPAQGPEDLRVRPLGRADLPEVERHLLALGPADRRARFGLALGDAAVAAYARRIDPDRAVLVGAADGPGGRLVGLAEAQPTGAPGRVEMAVSVHAPHRRRGLGRRLVGAALAAAFEARGAEAAEFLFDPGNRPIAGLVRALGARIGATLDRAEVRRPGPAAPPRAA
jgi:ribosomal protein S18 acetylase RimI-like enzyme